MKSSDTIRFWSKANKNSGIYGRYNNYLSECWIWTFSCDKGGYGEFNIDGKTTKAHRVAYSLIYNDDIISLDISHKCQNASCVRPDHLQALDRASHIIYDIALRGHYNSNKVYCKRGHEFNHTNTRVSKDGRRECKKCNLEYSRSVKGRNGIANKNKTHCAQGHEFNDQNTGFRNNHTRYCKECHRIRGRNRHNVRTR